MRSINKLLLTLILAFLIWRWLSQQPETQTEMFPERRKQPYYPAEEEQHVVAPDQQDDLTRIKGIGQKSFQALERAGVHTFEQLASLDAEDIKAILKAYGLRSLDPTTWPKQAAGAVRRA
jgi:predicted flap endonuclease-1-like 5' DNA nuclease